MATTLNWVYDMKSKYSGSVSLPCSILSGEYCWVYVGSQEEHGELDVDRGLWEPRGSGVRAARTPAALI